jgi:hypothetical protein
MTCPYPARIRARAGPCWQATEADRDDLGIHPVTLSKWNKQDDVDRDARPGVPSSESRLYPVVDRLVDVGRLWIAAVSFSM